MPLTLTDFQDRFKKFGKIIFAANQIGPQVESIRKAHMGLVDQQASGAAAEFNVFQDVVAVLGAAVVKATAAMTKLADADCKTAAETYLRKYIAPELGLTSSASTATISTTLYSEMSGVGANVADDGLFSSYFGAKLGIGLPETSGVPTIPDDWVTDAQV